MAKQPPAPPPPPRRRQRRKDARPSEIIEAAIELFGERGFGATRLEDVARRAGVAKGTVFVYFANKDELFRAVAQTVLTSHLERLRGVVADLDRPVAELVPQLLAQASLLGSTRLPAMMRLLISESRAFPDLARVWYDEVVSHVLGLLTAAVARSQERGEVRAGNPRLIAFSIMGPMLAGVLFREVFGNTGAALPDLPELAAEHAQTVLNGVLLPGRSGES